MKEIKGVNYWEFLEGSDTICFDWNNFSSKHELYAVKHFFKKDDTFYLLAHGGKQTDFYGEYPRLFELTEEEAQREILFSSHVAFICTFGLKAYKEYFKARVDFIPTYPPEMMEEALKR